MRIFVSLVVLAFSVPSAWAFEGFEKESASLSSLIKCENPTKVKRSGMVFSCVGGENKTVKVYLSEKKKKVKSIKLVWKEYTTDIGHGIGKDRALANEWLNLLVKQYGIDNPELQKVFWDGEETSKKANGYLVEASTAKSSTLVQHRLVISPK